MRASFGVLKSLLEAAVSPASASEQGLALSVFDDGNKTVFTLYDVAALIKTVEELFENRYLTHDAVRMSDDAIVGMIEIFRAANPCNGANEVTGVAARKGYGPLLYDIAMSTNGPLIADRSAVTPAAAKVWDAYAWRSDVTSKELDDIDNPQTPDPNDDCRVYDDPSKSAMNSSYDIQNKVDTNKLKQNDVEAMKKINVLAEKHGNDSLDEKFWSKTLSSAAMTFFISQYRKAPK